MGSSTLGKQRASRRSHRNGAGCRFLAALGASVILGFGVGAPFAAAQSRSQVPLHGEGGDASRGDQRDEFRREVERLFEQFLAELRERKQGIGTQSPPPEVHPPVTTPTTMPAPEPSPPPVAVPPVTVPNPVGPLPAAASGGTAAPTAQLDAASAGVVAASTGNGGASVALPPQHAPSPPAATPSTAPRSPVARALRTARSYGALLALAAAVVVFLLIQGYVDRRDPRILSAPAEDHLSFRDFE